MSSFYFSDSNTDAGPPSVGPQNGKYCMDGVNWVCEHRFSLTDSFLVSLLEFLSM